MKFLFGVTVKLIGLVVSFSVLCTAITTVSEHLDRDNEPRFAKTISRMIDDGLTLLPDSLESGAKNALTALDSTVSDITKRLIVRMSP